MDTLRSSNWTLVPIGPEPLVRDPRDPRGDPRPQEFESFSSRDQNPTSWETFIVFGTGKPLLYAKAAFAISRELIVYKHIIKLFALAQGEFVLV